MSHPKIFGRALVMLLLLIATHTALLSCSPQPQGAGQTEGLQRAQGKLETPEVGSTVPEKTQISQIEAKMQILREKMVREQIQARGIDDERVLRAMLAVPRHKFVPEEYIDQAYADHPVPIGEGQTISQPYIVALMTQALALTSNSVVLEIGTGSGYQAAVLSLLARQVYTVEIIQSLAEKAEARLKALGYSNVSVLHADGYFGWEEHAPFDAIIVTAAPDHIPPPLVKQLKNGGRLVIPVGPQGSYQTLWKVTKIDDDLQFENLGEVVFVPLVRSVK